MIGKKRVDIGHAVRDCRAVISLRAIRYIRISYPFPFPLTSYTHSNLFLKIERMIPVIPANIGKLKSVGDTLLLLRAKSIQETEAVTQM